MLPQLWQTMSDFNEILRQHCEVKLQTSHQISAKSVNICNSYNKFSKVTQSISVQYRHTRDWLSSVHPCEWQDVSTLKVCVLPNTSSKTWTPLPDHFIDDHLVEMFPFFDQARLQLVDVANLAVVHTLLQLPPNLVVDWVKVTTVGCQLEW